MATKSGLACYSSKDKTNTQTDLRAPFNPQGLPVLLLNGVQLLVLGRAEKNVGLSHACFKNPAFSLCIGTLSEGL